MINRRQFLQTAALSTAGALLTTRAFAKRKLINSVGIQLFSVPKALEADFPGTLKMLATMGYKEVELYGPYSFSTQSAKDHWAAVTPSLGFSGSGFFGHTASEVKAILAANGLTAPSMHTDLDTLQTAMDPLAEAAHILGSTYVVLPAIPQDKRQTLDDYRKMADAFNSIGEKAKKAGVKFAYHNHGYGWHAVNGQVPIKLILDNTDPSTVFLEMDLYWTTAGGADPVQLLTHYAGRYRMMHIKDMSKKVQFSGDGGDSKQWIELFPYMTSAGSGVLDLKTILTTAKNTGLEHFIVEQDMVAHPEVALKKSYDYLASL
jgi:sugar phosphate isomerase/epimerase